MKVFVIDPSGFSFPYDQQLCQALADQGHEVELIARALRPKEVLNPNGRFTHVPFYYRYSEKLKSRSKLFKVVKAIEHWWDNRRLLKYIKSSAPDIIHVQWTPVPLFDKCLFARLAGRYKMVLTVHDSHFMHGAGHLLQYWAKDDIYDYFDRFIVHTEKTRRYLLENGFDDNLISIIPHGPLPLDFSKSEFFVRDQLPDKYLLFFGNIKKYKGLDSFLLGFSKVPADVRKEWRVLIGGAGEPSYVQSLKNLAETLNIQNHTIWHSWFLSEDEIAHYVKHCQAIVFPYLEIDASGAFALVLSAERPILCSRTGVFEEYITHGRNGLLFTPGDSEEIGQVLTSFMKDEELRRQLKDSSNLTEQKLMGWVDISRLHISAYQSV